MPILAGELDKSVSQAGLSAINETLAEPTSLASGEATTIEHSLRSCGLALYVEGD